jgi:hypothetical protein
MKIKVDRRKNYYVVLDTEGLGLNDYKKKIYGRQKSYDIGYVIIDKKGHIVKHFNVLTKEIFGDMSLMSTAHFHNKMPIYEQMISDKEVTERLFINILRELKRDLKEFNIKGIFAYNCNYDIVALAETAQYTIENCPKLTFEKTSKGKWKPQHEKLLQKLLETKVEFYDIWTMACMTLCQQKTFLANAKLTPKGNIITNAETVYNYITDQENFIEDHTAYSDACIEAEILVRIFANGCKPQKQICFPFRLIPKELYIKEVK